MTAAWSYSGAPPPIGGLDAAQTLVEGSLFCVATPTGDIPTGGPHGLFFRDLRSLSRWELRVDGDRLEVISSVRLAPY